MKTWNYRGNQSGYKTSIQRYADGDIVICQASNGLAPGLDTADDVVRFNEKELRKILRDMKQAPRKKSKRGKK